MSVTVKDLGYLKIMRELAILDKTVVGVGIQSDAGEGVAERAFCNEYGTENIPERSFIRAAYDENAKDLDGVIDRLWGGVKAGKIGAKKAAEILGDRHEKQIKAKIKKGPFAANDESTIKRKKSSNPLINTGEMRNSIRYEVK